MQPLDFVGFHEAALESDEIRHSLLLSIIGRLRAQPAPSGIQAWTLGDPGACAAQTPGFPIVLGNLSEAQCRAFADSMNGADYPGVVGSDDTALWFAHRARELDAEFADEIPQEIQTLSTPPLVPSVAGFPRQLSPKDFRLFRAWTHAFISEAVPSDPVPSDDALMKDLHSRRHWLWIFEDKPVSMAAIARRTRRAAFINSVYTPAEYRNEGFGSAVTATAARQIFEEGLNGACLYVDLRNPASLRCYAKLGFQTVCKSWLVLRSKREGLKSAGAARDEPKSAD